MNLRRILNRTLVTTATLGLLSGTALADSISVTIENTQPDGYFYLTPFWVAAHNGGFDSYDGGDLAANFPGITEVAENGNTGPISDSFAASAAGMAGGVDTTLTAVSGMGDAPVFSPGESTTALIDIGDASINRYFSYASMVVPSNDLFVANGDATAHELFDAMGNFNGPLVIEIYGRDVNDNGTEVNSATNDAAFSALDGQSLPENVVIRNLFTEMGDQGYLDSFIGTEVATGETLTGAFHSDSLIARITIVPEPTTLLTLVIGGVALLRRR